MMNAGGQERGDTHVLLVPLPAQGHTNPMLQFGRRLAYHGLRPTLALTRYVLSTGPPPGDPFRVAAISDGFDAGGMGSCPDPVEYCRKAEAVGSETLAQVIAAEARAGRTPAVMVYDPHMSWAPRVARAACVPTAAFMSQSCAVDLIYGEAWADAYTNILKSLCDDPHHQAAATVPEALHVPLWQSLPAEETPMR